jgi:hypothetical protein
MEQIAAALNQVCVRWLDSRHHRRTGRAALARQSFVARYHQRRNHAAKSSRLRRYLKTKGAL